MIRKMYISINYIHKDGTPLSAEVEIPLNKSDLSHSQDYPNIVDTAQRAVANALEELKKNLDNPKNV